MPISRASRMVIIRLSLYSTAQLTREEERIRFASCRKVCGDMVCVFDRHSIILGKMCKLKTRI